MEPTREGVEQIEGEGKLAVEEGEGDRRRRRERRR